MRKILAFAIVFIGIMSIFNLCIAPIITEDKIKTEVNINMSRDKEDIENKKDKEKIVTWELTLVNYENALPEDFEIRLSNIDKIRQFDKRAINYLNEMLLDMKAQGIMGIWVQSSYRSVKKQQEVFNEQVNEYIKKRKIKKRSRRNDIKNNK